MDAGAVVLAVGAMADVGTMAAVGAMADVDTMADAGTSMTAASLPGVAVVGSFPARTGRGCSDATLMHLL
jgi:hypothetical protein